VRRFLFIIVLLLSCNLQANSFKPTIAIIIDDIGYQKSDFKLIDLPYALTFSVLPHTPYGQRTARYAFSRQRDVMLHMPMQSTHHTAEELGTLSQHMTKQQVQHSLQTALADIPYAIGINNHMGSLFTELEQHMAWTMEYLQHRHLFFVDSLTTPRSTADKYASEYGVTSLSRHVFLDNEQTEDAISKQFDQLIRLAKSGRPAIAIGHPYPETYNFLRKHLPLLKQQGIQLVGISKLLPQEHSVVAAGFTAPAVSAPQ